MPSAEVFLVLEYYHLSCGRYNDPGKGSRVNSPKSSGCQEHAQPTSPLNFRTTLGEIGERERPSTANPVKLTRKIHIIIPQDYSVIKSLYPKAENNLVVTNVP